MRNRQIASAILAVAVLAGGAALSSCAARFSGIYYADGDIGAQNMLIFSDDSRGLLENGLGEADDTVAAVTMGVTEQGTYTISGDRITFKFGDVTSIAEYDRETETIIWYGVKYIKPPPSDAKAGPYLY